MNFVSRLTFKRMHLQGETNGMELKVAQDGQ